VKTTYIYTLAHPETGVIRYISKTDNLGTRLVAHLREKNKTAKCCWVQSLIKKGLHPIMELLDEVPHEDWMFWEVYWIAQFKAWGYELYNGDNGGLGSHRLPASVRKKIADTIRGREVAKLFIPCHQYDLQGNYLKTYPSAKSVAKEMGLTPGNLSRASRRGTAFGGYLWRKGKVKPENVPGLYAEDGKRIMPESERKKRSDSGKRRNWKPVMTQAGRDKLRVLYTGKAPANKGVSPTAEQYAKSCAAREKTKKSVAQHNLLTGELIRNWPSIKEAAEGTGATRAGILNVIKGKSRHAAGYVWVR
jgi:hypothetical protein